MTEPPAARALILDFGGVISRSMYETHALSEAALGLAPGTLTWRGPFDPAGDPEYRAMQAGEISERDYWMIRTREVAALVGADWTGMSDFVRAARGASPEEIIRPEFLETHAACRAAGVRLAILSNELDLFYGADFRGRLPFLQDFDPICDATHTGVLKPDPRAYGDVLDRLGLPAAACVFVDDQARNVAGARACGIPAIHFDMRDPAGGFAAARALLGLEA